MEGSGSSAALSIATSSATDASVPFCAKGNGAHWRQAPWLRSARQRRLAARRRRGHVRISSFRPRRNGAAAARQRRTLRAAQPLHGAALPGARGGRKRQVHAPWRSSYAATQRGGAGGGATPREGLAWPMAAPPRNRHALFGRQAVASASHTPPAASAIALSSSARRSALTSVACQRLSGVVASGLDASSKHSVPAIVDDTQACRQRSRHEKLRCAFRD